MSTIPEIIDELNQSNSTNYKLDVLRKYKDNQELQEILKLTYDKVTYTFGIKKIPSYVHNQDHETLFDGVHFLKTQLATRNLTGNNAISSLSKILAGLKPEDAKIIECILDRDLKINLGKSQINKVFKDLIIKPPYMRCSTYSVKTIGKINFPAILQLKADGMFQYAMVDNGSVTFTSRSGEENTFPYLEEIFKNLEDGVYVGELLVKGIANRQEANGLINSDNPPHKLIYMQLWDFISLKEYNDSKHTSKINRLQYSKRFDKLSEIVGNVNTEHIQIIQTHTVQNIQEALQLTSRFMTDGFEGSILKDSSNIFKDHTSPTQLKLKLAIELDMRCTGFTEGTKGTKRENTFGAITFQNDDGSVRGQCSGFTDSQLEDFNKRREELIGKIFAVECNDLTKARDNDYYALSHPRFIEFRNDKDTTDSLDRCLEIRNSAMLIG